MGSRACQSSPMGNMDYRQPDVGSNPNEYSTGYSLYSQPFQVEHPRGKQMNIKHKAALITLAIPVILFALFFMIATFPMILFVAVFGGLSYLVYRAVLNYLEYKDRWKQ